MKRHAVGVLGVLQDRLPALGESARTQAEAVLAARSTLVDELDRIRRVDRAGLRTRIHGDYHLGQVLRAEEDIVILDFEGEPARPLSERRAKQSPLKDVAGMMRSFSYAAYAALFAFTVHAPAEYTSLEPWADTWQHWASESFLQGYCAAMGQAAIVPHGASFSELLRAFALEKAMYELGYELNNRPDWVRIPLTGILKLAARLQS